MTRGVCLIAYGQAATQAVDRCARSLRRWHDWPIEIMSLVGDEDRLTNVQRSRWAKVTLDEWSPFDETLYLDADTLINGEISLGFDLLDDGWELIIAPSQQQGENNLWHVSPAEREMTLRLYQCHEILQLQGGVFWFKRSAAITKFFEAWRYEYPRFYQYDQAALLRALAQAPIKIHLLSNVFNGGALIAHQHGRAAG